MSYFQSGLRDVNPIELICYTYIKRVPLILQSEVAECGLAVLAMIATYYGHKSDLHSMRKYIDLNSQGMTLKRMVEIAGDLNLTSRAIKCEIEDVNQLQTPCVIHWNLNHFVVLTKTTKKWIYINDPAIGKRKLTHTQFSESYTGIALELSPASDFKKIDVREKAEVSQLWNKIFGFKRSFAALLSFSILLQFTSLLAPYYIQMVIDSVLLSNDKSLLLVLAIGFVILTLIQVFISTLRGWFVIRLSSLINIQLASNLFHHLMRLPLSFFEKRHIGDIVSRFGSLNAIKDLLATGLIESIIDGLVSIVILAMMFYYNVSLTILTIVVVFISFFIQLTFFYPNRRIKEESIFAAAKENSIFLESVRAIQTIKLFSHESARQNLWLNRYADFLNAEIRLGIVNLTENSINNLLWGVETTLIIYFGALAVMDAKFSVGMLIAFIAYKDQFISAMTRFIDRIISFKLISLHLERLSDITFQDKEHYIGQASLNQKIVGCLRLEKISFRYSDDSEWVFKDISLQINAGESVAITGASGCGKTTLLKVLLGLLKPTSGTIYIDDIDASELSLNEYRKQFGAVMQDDKLFSGSLIENITMYDSNYDENKLIQCCETACILNEIKNLPMGFHTQVGDMGSCFSGGQLQRIYLARALYKEPKILCLDESTSHLDSANEFTINHNIGALSLTKIIIAHRKETIDTAERLIRLDEL